jgi:uncharacterized membrane protein YhaH (DUF805 family)
VLLVGYFVFFYISFTRLTREIQLPSEASYHLFRKTFDELIIAILVPIFFALLLTLILLIDCIKRRFPDKMTKLYWILVILFSNLMGATIYYLKIVRRDLGHKSNL